MSLHLCTDCLLDDCDECIGGLCECEHSYLRKQKVDRRCEMGTREELAKEHADWLMPLLRQVYEDAFLHGYKHGKDAE